MYLTITWRPWFPNHFCIIIIFFLVISISYENYYFHKCVFINYHQRHRSRTCPSYRAGHTALSGSRRAPGTPQAVPWSSSHNKRHTCQKQRDIATSFALHRQNRRVWISRESSFTWISRAIFTWISHEFHVKFVSCEFHVKLSREFYVKLVSREIHVKYFTWIAGESSFTWNSREIHTRRFCLCI